MHANSGGRKSMDSLSPSSPHGPRHEFPFHSRQGSTSTLQPRRGSFASSIHSIGGALDSSPGTWANTVAESSQNAISTLLQPPIVRTGLLPHTSAPTTGHRMPTARDIQPVTLTNITRVDAAEFRTYLTQVGALHEQLRRAKENDDDPSDQQRGRKGSKGDDFSPEDDSHLRPGTKRPPASKRKSSVSSVRSISSLTSPIDPPTPVRRSSSGFARRAAQGPPPLSTIPNVYFDEDFHLENPRTFDVVSERSEVISKTPAAGGEEKTNGNAAAAAVAPRKALATNAILQEKLSWYMDTVEMHLISSISAASTTFFTALGSLKGLHTEAAESVDRIKTLRQELEALDGEIVSRGLEIVQQRRRRENLQQLHSAVMQLRDVVDGVGKCEAQVEDGNVDEALDTLDSLELLIAGQVEPFTGFNRPARAEYALRDLSGAAALQGVHDDMNTLRFRIGKIYEGRLIELLLGDLRRHVETVSKQEVMMRWSTASNRGRTGHSREPSAYPSYMANQDDLRQALPPILAGLQRARHLSAATAAYRDVAMREIRAIIRKPLPSSNEDDNESMMSSSTLGGAGRQRTQQQKSSVLARNLRNLEREDAEELLVTIYIGVTETLRRTTTHGKLLLDVASSIGDESAGPDGLKSPPIRSPPFSPPQRRTSMAGLEAQEEIHKALELNNLLGQAVDVAQDKIVKLLRVRAEQSTHLPLVWFLRYFTLNLHFATECESISGRSGTTLKTVVNGQIKEFVQLHGDSEKQKLAQGMEQDQWAAQDFTEKDQEMLDIILQCETKDAAMWTDGSKVWIHPSELNGKKGDTTENSAAPSEPAGEKENGAAAAGKAKVRGAVIEGETYLLPSSAVLCLEGMSNFLHLAVAIPSMAADVAASLVAYLQLFNSRCTQLILGAGATRSAGLKNITTKHLAIASQALGFVATMVPHVREFVRRHVPGADKPSGTGSGSNTTTLIGEFDKVRRLYQEHQNSIYDKLVEIMSGRAAMHSKTMRTIDWDEGGEVHPYMDTLGRETSTLHRNLTKALPDSTVRFIMAPVFASYKEAFGKVLVGASVRTEEGRESMVRDFEYFRVKLGKIDGFGDAADHLLDIIRKKKLEGGGGDGGKKKDNGSLTVEEGRRSKGDESGGETRKSTESRAEA
ncbi:hypothetical protein MCOR27_004182 [Pyricularia oryzae]|uniref:Vacuolar protein sorting-associated protein 54 C-terminal domain-containing protein n=1 Tax=Pyricularia grisea TaxID=148305 RepID=A0ABQ8NGH7_PYRGI|nr:hypothetical protein MCOR01_001993 [Pyricularia oryzae]KAI6296705.1 hypothetical protein MCOR33_006752 [Pyricularia grisea]KAI6257819.1 hypothetical protein MCOR19_005763 [Pyricularia oryzae]KAI6272901.1 hypothetical protein MCOR26_007132 [Pyricularia oryzae]KAI6281487.1 hypothetical protein MCOR27_004182 [Pyricularia oryzae]